MIPSLIALLTWQLAAWLAFALVEPRPRTRLSISKQSTRYHIFTRSLDVSENYLQQSPEMKISAVSFYVIILTLNP